MLIVTVNSGSTSVRLGLFERAGATLERRTLVRKEAAEGQDAEVFAAEVLAPFLAEVPGEIAAVVHRVVHAGANRRVTQLFDQELRAAITDMIPLAPLHNPPALAWAAAAVQRLPKVPQLAAFDSGFFRNLPAVATTYGLPADLAGRTGITRLGFHGFAHQSMWEAFNALRPHRSARVISLQLGGGCSATALRNGQPIDTSMGFSPLEGLLMATRSGDLDPGALLHLARSSNLDRDALQDLLNQRSGLLGISGISGDVRDLLGSDAPAAALALDVYGYRIRKQLGAYWAALGGYDAVLVGGGAGVGSAALRAHIFRDLEALGIEIDESANTQAAAPARISTSASPVEVWVIPTDEERLLAAEGAAWLARPQL
jgi:acetate kinase